MIKTFVLDTNVLLMDPEAIFSFEENEVIIPLAVVEEIDELKTKSSDLGYNARETSRILDELRSKGKLSKGIKLDNGGTLRIVINGKDLILPTGLSSTKMDNRILSTAVHLQRDNPQQKVILVSNDINLRLMAETFDIKSEEHKSDRLSVQNIYTGYQEIEVISQLIDEFYSKKEITPKSIKKDIEIFPQEMVQLTAFNEQNKSALGRYDGKSIKPLLFENYHPSGISPLNREQTLALELLLDDSIKLVTLAGKAGTGKTLLALAAGLSRVVDHNKFKRLLVARPVIPMGKDIGFLPGSKEEKMQPWMQPIFDNLDFIINGNKKSSYTFDKLIDEDLIQIEALTYIRGRSVPDQFIIIDEAQNLSHHEVKTIITRAGHNTKIVLTGDPFQIDNPYLNLYKNGLTYLAYKFHDKKIAGHIMLQKGERSELASIASEIL